MKEFTAFAFQTLGIVDEEWQPIAGNLVTTAIRAEPVPEWEIDSIAKRIVLAADLWLEEDLRSDDLLVEWRFDNEIKGVLDLYLARGGKAKIVDWKSTSDLKRPNYLDELKAEFQGPFYLTYGKPEGVSEVAYLEYRVLDEKGQVATPTVLREEWTLRSTTYQLQELHGMYLSQSANGSWTRHMPRACFRGGQKGPDCPFLDDCQHMTMPTPDLHSELVWDKRPRSKSAMGDFLHCPEQYRRTRLLGESLGPRSVEIVVGESFHRGLASLWQAAWDNRTKLIR